MPGPSSQNKKKRKTPSTSSAVASSASGAGTFTIPEGLFADIDDGATWQATVEMLCRHFELPDLTTRHGLKKVHAHFDRLYSRLDSAFVTAEKRGIERAMGGIVGIWSKMCADAILRDKLFQKGLLSRIMPILNIDSTRLMGLNALALVTHHGGVHARTEIAKKNLQLIQLMRAHPDDAKVMELVTVTISHATGAVLALDETPDPRVVKAVNVRDVMQTTMENIRKPIASHYMIDHAISLFINSTQHCPKECAAAPGLLNLLVALLRSSNLGVRCQALCGIIRYTASESQFDYQNFDPQRFIAMFQRGGVPPHLSEILVDYGMERAEITMTIRASVDYQKAMMRAAQDRNLLSLGETLAGLIQRTEYSIAEGGFQAEDARGRLEIMDVGLPFKMWTDSLPCCARELRKRGLPGDLDAADVLDLKFFIMRQRVRDAIDLAERALARNPELTYAYYALSMGAEHERGLRAVKKGLKCKKVTPFLRMNMLWRAIEHAGDMGTTTLATAREGEGKHTEGVAFLMSAWEDAKTFTAEAPPDNRHMMGILDWYILLTLAIKGPELSTNLSELAAAQRKINSAAEFMGMLGLAINKTQTRLARMLILKLYSKASEEWGPFVQHFDEMNASGGEALKPLSSSQADDDLAAWLENMQLDDDDDDEHGRHPCTHPKISTSNVALYRCSWCSNPSAVLKKCGGCGKTRYCDGVCQKKHWSDHKRDCKKA
ncbi:uncharacterized protein BXZ73DRAFT_42148 [Epithele typhae]|uniref:uncharacterized protein n=1 Tax=Epithele typhae TaxID=378194 RepID=UPI00200847E3|nr:uncharacterized protein BXZ73DRAFT_42148 [Epithele typhae]KAH9941110.1 hypothetical protein BXZ73DRAFT_42148 [Epithele typhae]